MLICIELHQRCQLRCIMLATMVLATCPCWASATLSLVGGPLQGLAPSALQRWGHTTTTVGNKLIVFGGYAALLSTEYIPHSTFYKLASLQSHQSCICSRHQR